MRCLDISLTSSIRNKWRLNSKENVHFISGLKGVMRLGWSVHSHVAIVWVLMVDLDSMTLLTTVVCDFCSACSSYRAKIKTTCHLTFCLWL